MEATIVLERKSMKEMLDERWNESRILATLIGAYNAHLTLARDRLYIQGEDVTMLERFMKMSKHIWEHRHDTDMTPEKAIELITITY